MSDGIYVPVRRITVFPRPDFMKKDGVISAFYRIFGLSFEYVKQLIIRVYEKDIGTPTVDLWRHEPRRRNVYNHAFAVGAFGDTQSQAKPVKKMVVVH